MDRLVSLAAGTVLDLDPAAAVDVAAAAGFGGVGIWFDPQTWTSATTAAVIGRLRATGIVPLDIEPVILGRDHDPGDALVDVAAELGVRHVLLASGSAERGAVVERFAELCDRAAPAGVVVVLEFLPIFTVATLGDAVAIVEEAGRPNGGVLVDTLHLARSGAAPEQLRRVPPALLPYLQVADASADAPGDRASLRDEALHGRLAAGRGRAATRRRPRRGAPRPAVARTAVDGTDDAAPRPTGAGPGGARRDRGVPVSERTVLVLTGGHRVDLDALLDMVAAICDSLGWRWAHARQPSAQRWLVPSMAGRWDAVLAHDIPGLHLRRGVPPTPEGPSPAVRRDLIELLRHGQGMVATHHALAGWPGWEGWAEALGGRFHYAPGHLRGRVWPSSGTRHGQLHGARRRR